MKEELIILQFYIALIGCVVSIFGLAYSIYIFHKMNGIEDSINSKSHKNAKK